MLVWPRVKGEPGLVLGRRAMNEKRSTHDVFNALDDVTSELRGEALRDARENLSPYGVKEWNVLGSRLVVRVDLGPLVHNTIERNPKFREPHGLMRVDGITKMEPLHHKRDDLMGPRLRSQEHKMITQGWNRGNVRGCRGFKYKYRVILEYELGLGAHVEDGRWVREALVFDKVWLK